MKILIKSALLLLLVTALIGCGSDVSSFDLVQREGIYYKKFSEVPFTGKVTGFDKGLIKNGKREGEWIAKDQISSLFGGVSRSKGNYKNGKKEGVWIGYHKNGQLYSKGNYKNGKKEGEWVNYNNVGTLNKEISGIYKDGEKISD